MYLERLEYGKPCISLDGPVEGGSTPEEYRALGATPDFPKDTVKWNFDSFGANFAYQDDISVIHAPYIAYGKKEKRFVSLTQLHRVRVENPQTNRNYIVSRFAASVGKSNNFLSVPPFILCASVLNEPLIGITRNTPVTPFLIQNDMGVFQDWSEIVTALRCVLSGIPICIKLVRLEDGGLFPSLEDFSRIGDTIWYFLPPSLRPWFSWAWNVADFSSNKESAAKKLMLVGCGRVPQNAVEYIPGTNIWQGLEILEQNPSVEFVNDWIKILETYDDMDKIAALSALFQENPLVDVGPYKALNGTPQPSRQIQIQEKKGYQLVSIDHLNQDNSILPLVRDSFRVYSMVVQTHEWMFQQNPSWRLRFDKIDHDALLEYYTKTVGAYWKQYTDNPSSMDKPKLIMVTWAYLYECKRLQQHTLLDKTKLMHIPNDVASFLLGCLQSETQNFARVAESFQFLLKLKESHPELFAVIVLFTETSDILPSFQNSMHQMLHIVSWPYDKMEIPDAEKGIRLFGFIIQIITFFPKWASQSSIRIHVLQQKIVAQADFMNWSNAPQPNPTLQGLVTFTKQNIDELKRKLSDPERLQRIIDTQEPWDKLQTSLPKSEQLALASYLWMTEIDDKSNSKPLSMMNLKHTEWLWSIFLQVDISNAKQITGDSPFAPWFCLVRYGLNTLRLQFPEIFKPKPYNPTYDPNSALKKDQQTHNIASIQNNIFEKLQLLIISGSVIFWPVVEKNVSNIAELYFTYFSSKNMGLLNSTLRTFLYQYFPKYWPLILHTDRGDEILGQTKFGNDSWEIPLAYIKENEKNVLEKIHTRYTSMEPESNDIVEFTLFTKNILQSLGIWPNIQMIIERLSQMENQQYVLITTQEKILHSYILYRMILLDKTLQSHIQRRWEGISSSIRAKDVLTLLQIYVQYSPMVMQGQHILALMNLIESSKSKPILMKIVDVMRQSSDPIAQKNALTIFTLLLQPKIFSAPSELWNDAYKNTTIALCFPDKLDYLPKDHFDQWSWYFSLQGESLLRTILQFHKETKRLPTGKDKLIQILNSHFKKYMSVQATRQGIRSQRSQYVSAPDFEYVISNYRKLYSEQGKIEGINLDPETAQTLMNILLFIFTGIGLVVLVYTAIISGPIYTIVEYFIGYSTLAVWMRFGVWLLDMMISWHFIIYIAKYLDPFIDKFHNPEKWRIKYSLEETARFSKEEKRKYNTFMIEIDSGMQKIIELMVFMEYDL